MITYKDMEVQKDLSVGLDTSIWSQTKRKCRLFYFLMNISYLSILREEK